MGREGLQDTRETGAVCINVTAGGGESWEIASGKRGGKVVSLVDVRSVYFYAPARRTVFVELPPEDYQPGDEHMCGLLLRYSLFDAREAAHNWEEELTSTFSSLKLTWGSACPCVCRGIISYTSYSRTNDYVKLWLRHCVQLYAQQHHA